MAGFGDTLRQARAHKGVTLKEAEQATRINRHHLASLEEEDFGALPPLIYQRGIVRNYAVYLDLDPSRLLGMFEEAQGLSVSTGHGGMAPVPPIDMPSHWAPNFAIIAFAVVLSAIIFAWGYSIYVAPPGEESTATATSANTTPLASTIDLPTELPATPAPPTPMPTEAPSPTPTAEQVAEVAGRQDGGDNQRSEDAPADAPADAATTNDQQVVEQRQEELVATTETEAPVNAYVTGMSVTAVTDLYLTVTVDGNVVFDGTLAAGQQTDQFVGTEFSFYTSSGVNTDFTNACGDTFKMGYEEGEVTYPIVANENSCKP
jgi:cytoskeletal protein RodZ